jgi:DNA-binding transcriptional ArsR family regulator
MSLLSESPLKAVQVLRDPNVFQLLADETRRKILYLLRVREMSVCELSEELKLTPQALYHHIKKLQEGGMVEVTREERCGHLIESYYRATAEDFLITTGKLQAKTVHDKKLTEEMITSALQALNKVGMKLALDKDKISQLVEMQAGLTHECCKDDEEFVKAYDAIWNMDDVNILAKQIAAEFLGTLTMSNEEFTEQQGSRKKLRDLLLSLKKK